MRPKTWKLDLYARITNRVRVHLEGGEGSHRRLIGEKLERILATEVRA